MIALVFAVIVYCRAFFTGRHRLGMEVAALRHQLVVIREAAAAVAESERPRGKVCAHNQRVLPGPNDPVWRGGTADRHFAVRKSLPQRTQSPGPREPDHQPGAGRQEDRARSSGGSTWAGY